MSRKQAIGGYFELELRQYDSLFHDTATAVNSGRNAFAYILKRLAVKKVYLPSYICPVMLQPLQKYKIDYAFYALNEDLEPNQGFSVGDDEYIVYVNYFGLKNSMARKLAQEHANTIIDNAQAFFHLPHHHTPTFYSPRKFFGVPDGGFVYLNANSKPALLPNETSFERCAHLLKRIELGPSQGFSDFKLNEQQLTTRSVAGMSFLTKKILFNIDYEWIRRRRNSNFAELHACLQRLNQLSHIMDESAIDGPMMYPYLCDKNNLREHLHENNIFTPTYWPQLSEMGVGLNGFESYLAEHLIPLPIDQRYGLRDMHRIVSVIEEFNG